MAIKKEILIKSQKDEFTCRRCKKEVAYLQNGLCNGCINKVSFMDYWQIETPEEAVRLFLIQDLNNEIYNENEKVIKKLKPYLVNGRVKECPKSLEEFLKKSGEWDNLLKRVQQILIDENETKKEKTRLDYYEDQLEFQNEKLEKTKQEIEKIEFEILRIKTLEGL